MLPARKVVFYAFFLVKMDVSRATKEAVAIWAVGLVYRSVKSTKIVGACPHPSPEK